MLTFEWTRIADFSRASPLGIVLAFLAFELPALAVPVNLEYSYNIVVATDDGTGASVSDSTSSIPFGNSLAVSLGTSLAVTESRYLGTATGALLTWNTSSAYDQTDGATSFGDGQTANYGQTEFTVGPFDTPYSFEGFYSIAGLSVVNQYAYLYDTADFSIQFLYDGHSINTANEFLRVGGNSDADFFTTFEGSLSGTLRSSHRYLFYYQHDMVDYEQYSAVSRNGAASSIGFACLALGDARCNRQVPTPNMAILLALALVGIGVASRWRPYGSINPRIRH